MELTPQVDINLWMHPHLDTMLLQSQQFIGLVWVAGGFEKQNCA